MAPRSPRPPQLELDVAQPAATHVRGLQVTDDALGLATGIVDDDLDRVDALDHATGGRATSAHELGQLGAQIVVEGS